MFQKGTKGHAIYTIVEAVLFMVVGILALVFRENTDSYGVAFIIVGSVLIFAAAVGIIFNVILAAANPVAHSFFDAKTGALISSTLELSLGIALIIGGKELLDQIGGLTSTGIVAVINFVALFAGLAAIIYGAIYAVYATTYVVRAEKGTKAAAILPYVLAAIAITAGILLLVFVWNSNDLMVIVFVFAGIIGLLAGLLLLGYGILELAGKIQADDNDKVAATVDVDATEESENN